VMGVAIAGMHYTGMSAAHFVASGSEPSFAGFVLASDGLAAVVATGTLAILVLTLIGAVIDRHIQSEVEHNQQLMSQTMELACQAEESRRLSEELEAMNAELQRSLEDAERARRQLAEEHEAYAALQYTAQREAAKSRWLAGVAEAATALAHEVNNPLTTLMMHAEILGELGEAKTPESPEEILKAARRIAAVIKRLTDAGDLRSVPYLGGSRMIDLKDSA
jgi:signal transduction histidine kinase